jgi:hypothetical protein
MQTNSWYSVIYGGRYNGPRGPWKSAEEGKAAIQRYGDSRGYRWGTELAIASLSIVGPYRTREIAKGATPQDVMFQPEHRRDGAQDVRTVRWDSIVAFDDNSDETY